MMKNIPNIPNRQWSEPVRHPKLNEFLKNLKDKLANKRKQCPLYFSKIH